jgi:hypothetical protein
MRADHHAAVQAIEADHAAEFGREEEVFEDARAKIQAWAEKCAVEKTAGIAQEIAKLQKQITARKSRPPAPDDQSETAATFAYFDKWEKEMIEKLELQRRDANAERLQALLKLKERLNQCVLTLEELEKAQLANIKELKGKSRTVDVEYEKKLRDVTQKHRKQITQLQRNIEDEQAQVREIDEMITTFQKTRAETEVEDLVATDKLRREIRDASAHVFQPPEETGELVELQAKLAKLQEQLMKQDAVLETERNVNNELTSRVARVRGELRIAERRAALDI